MVESTDMEPKPSGLHPFAAVTIPERGKGLLELLLGAEVGRVAALLLAAVVRAWVQPSVAPAMEVWDSGSAR